MLSQHVHVVSHVWRNRQPEQDPRMPPSYSAVAGKGGLKEEEADKKEKERAKDADKKEKERAKDAEKNEKEGAKHADMKEKEGTNDTDKDEEGAKDKHKNEEEEEERWFRKDVFHLRSREFR